MTFNPYTMPDEKKAIWMLDIPDYNRLTKLSVSNASIGFCIYCHNEQQMQEPAYTKGHQCDRCGDHGVAGLFCWIDWYLSSGRCMTQEGTN